MMVGKNEHAMENDAKLKEPLGGASLPATLLVEVPTGVWLPHLRPESLWSLTGRDGF